jgi:hypothetical protein
VAGKLKISNGNHFRAFGRGGMLDFFEHHLYIDIATSNLHRWKLYTYISKPWRVRTNKACDPPVVGIRTHRAVRGYFVINTTTLTHTSNRAHPITRTYVHFLPKQSLVPRAQLRKHVTNRGRPMHGATQLLIRPKRIYFCKHFCSYFEL